MEKIYLENKDGVHLLNPIACEFSICGDAIDIGTEDDMDDMVRVDKKVVTCKRCVEVITTCRHVKVRKSK